MQLPTVTYHVTGLWPDGTLLNAECGVTRDEAFDAAAEWATKLSVEVRVEAIYRQYLCTPVAENVTADFIRERMAEVAA